MSARLLKPNAGTIARVSKSAVESGDGAVYPFLGGVASFITGLGGALTIANTGEELFALLFIWPVLFLTSVITYGVRTVEISYHDYYHYRDALKHWSKIEGKANEKLAKPLLDQIYTCTIEKHPRSYNKDCNCLERERLMEQLIVDGPTNRSDIEAAAEFIRQKKEREAIVNEEYKKLMLGS